MNSQSISEEFGYGILDEATRRDLGTFIMRAFQTLNPGEVYDHNWHIDAIAWQLQGVSSGQSRQLIINQPPRSLKSLSVSVAFVAWCLGNDHSMTFACVSYSAELAGQFARQFRQVIQSAWYRRCFPHVRFIRDTETECLTSHGGGRYAVSVGGSFTGRGADIIIVDDPQKAEEAMSETARRTVNDWFRGTLLSRLNDKRKGAVIIVMQRLHEDDLAGMLLRQGGWDHLDLPAIAVEDQAVQIGPHAWHRRKIGEALHPNREPLEVLEKLRRDMGSVRFSAQYQQRPVPAEGNLIRREWIQFYDVEPPRSKPGVEVVQSWDLASTTAERSDWSVCTTWLIDKRSYYLVDVWRGKLAFPYLRRKLVELARHHNANSLLIEKAGPGLHLIQELQANPENGVSTPIGIVPVDSKAVRMEAQAVRFEAGQVFLPNEAPWLSDLLNELLAFPTSRNDDQIDSVSQFLNWAERRYMTEYTSIAGPILVYREENPDLWPGLWAPL